MQKEVHFDSLGKNETQPSDVHVALLRYKTKSFSFKKKCKLFSFKILYVFTFKILYLARTLPAEERRNGETPARA